MYSRIRLITAVWAVIFVVRYVRTPEMERVVRKIIKDLSLHYIDSSRIRCVKSYQSRSLKTYARIHTASRAFLAGVGMPPMYVIEFVSENFDKLSEEEKIKVIIHELLHIPRSFGGGLITHGRLDFEEECERLYKFLQEIDKKAYGFNRGMDCR